MFKKGDVVIILSILLISFFAMYSTAQRDIESEKIVDVVHDNNLVASYRIDDAFEGKFDFYDGNGGHEVYWIHDGGVEVIQSNTPQKICMKMGFIDRHGQMIIALPHKMYISIRAIYSAEEESNLDAIVK